MCGIAGFFVADGVRTDTALSLLGAMGQRLFHRGPDDGDTWFDEAAGIGLVHRRLSIIDLSPLGRQPMPSSSGRYRICFNGEVFNYRELREELSGRGWSFRGESDTEVMLAAIEAWGLVPAVQRFVGMFAFALWDERERTMHLVRDRLGIKPLYYGTTPGGVVFGSELGAVEAGARHRFDVDRAAVGLLVRYGYIPAPSSILAGCSKLRPGTIATFRAPTADPIIEEYWSVQNVARRGAREPFAGDAREAADALHDVLSDAVRRRMIADVPLGAFLSGGIDSSTVVGIMQGQSSAKVKTYSIGFREAGFDEAPHARAIAAHLGTDHTEFYVSADDALAVVPRLPTIFDEPFADESLIPTYLVSALARKSVTVALSGDGGDELFHGYSRYMRAARAYARATRVPRVVRALAGSVGKALATDDRVRAGGRRSALQQARLARAGRLLSADSAAMFYEQVVSQREPLGVLVGAEAVEPVSLRRRLDGVGNDLWRYMQLWDMSVYMPDDVLTKVDRASMAVALEARVPLLDHRVVEFALRLPVQHNVDESATSGKHVLRRVLDRYVPRALVERPKMGFAVPIADWLRGPLREWAEDLLARDRLATAGLLDAREVRRNWDDHLAGRANNQRQLWAILMLQSWLAHRSAR